MMSPLHCIILSSTNMVELKTMSKAMTLTSEISNILIMTLAVLTLNKLMMMTECSKSEESMKKMINTTGIMVMLCFLLNQPFLFLAAMETTIIPLALVILNTSKDLDKKESIKFMIMMNTIGSIPFMLHSIATNFSTQMKYLEFSQISCIMMTLMLTLFLIKTPIFMFHLWLTKVHVSASGNCSMILASIMIKLGTVGIFKFSENYLSLKMLEFFTSLALYSCVAFSLMMLRYFDAKTLIAMSSILHMAMITPMILEKKSSSNLSSIMMMSAHGLISYFLFYLITITYEKTENRTNMMMKCMESSSKLLASLTTVFLLMNLGVPPLMNFYSESMFMFSLKIMNMETNTLLFCLSLLLSVIFTMQATTNLVFNKKEELMKKEISTMIMVKSCYFLLWSLMIIIYM